MTDDSVTCWIAALKEKDSVAAQRLWERYAERLIELARQRLGDAPRTESDEEDVVLSVFHTVWRAAVNGRFLDLKTRDELWWLLLRVTRQKTLDKVRRDKAEKRGGGRIVPLSELQAAETSDMPGPLAELISREPSPEYLAILAEEHDRLLRRLRDDRLRQVAVRRLQGLAPEEIAQQMRISVRTVHRKLRLIEEQWFEEVHA